MKTSTGDRSTGDCSTGDRSTGHWSTGYYSTGNYSTGNCSTGDRSTGDRSTGHYSTGDWSTGDWSTGYYSTGNWSISHYSTGYFSNIDYSGLSLFDTPITKSELEKISFPSWIYFDLTKWIPENEMNDREKIDNPNYKTTEGYLKVYDYQEAWKIAYDSVSREEQLKIKDIPHFNADIFFKISGIRIDEETSLTGKEVTVTVDGREYKAVIQ